MKSRFSRKSRFKLPCGKVASSESLTDGRARRVKAVIAAGTTESRRRVPQNRLCRSRIKRRIKVNPEIIEVGRFR